MADPASQPLGRLRTRRPLPVVVAVAAGALALGTARAFVPRDDDQGPGEQFPSRVRPVLAQYCFRCHGPERQSGDLRLDVLDPDLVHGPDVERWLLAREMLDTGMMPPVSAEQPDDSELDTVLSWLNTELERRARSLDEAPHAVLRRLNKAQYTHALQDLFGLSIEFGQVLPDDGRSKRGFSNDGEVLLASPLHLEYYQEIARRALDQALAIGERPKTVRYRVEFGKGRGIGHPGETTGGYQSVPLDPSDFVVEVLGADGRPIEPANEAERAEIERVQRKITVGFRGSSQDRFFSTPEGVVLYSALPHKEVAPGSWQGPSPNMKLEMQRVFPREGDFLLRVEASRGFRVTGRKELLVDLEDASPRVAIHPRPVDPESVARAERAMQPTIFGAWHQAGPFFTLSGEEARDTQYVPDRARLDFDAALADGTSTWTALGDVDDQIRQYETRIGALLLGRTVEAPSARTLELAIGSDDAVWFWRNGEPILAADVRRGVGRDQDFLRIPLVEGRNDLLMKVVNYGGGFASFTRTVHDGTSGGIPPYDVEVPDGAQVFLAERSDQRRNLRFESGNLVAVDFPADGGARFLADLDAGYYQFELVHPALPPQSMGSIRFQVGDKKLDLRPQLSPEEVAAGHHVTVIGGGFLNGGRHEIVVGGPFFVGFSHLVITKLPADHPLVVRLESQAEAEDSQLTPALRAYIGTRTDDGMDYKTFDRSQPVTAKRGSPETFTFRGRLENLPIPEPESGDTEILSGICVLGVWNDHLVKSRDETGPPLLVTAMEFEAPYFETWPPPSHTRIFFDSPHRDDPEVYTREVLATFLERAFRRPVEPQELERYVGFWHQVEGEYESYEEGVREVLVAALCSPSFLFLAEPTDAVDAEGRVDEAVLASRLSFFLWNSPPDERLRQLAAEGRLRDLLDTEVERLLDDPRRARFVRPFTREWLRLDRFENQTVNPNLFPAFTRFVKEDMAEETYRFVEEVLVEGLPALSLVDADFTMLNQDLAEFYGVEGVAGTGFRPVVLPAGVRQGGLLTQGSFLAGHSDGNEPHPIKRAVWVKERLLGQPPPPPPPNVPALAPVTPDLESLTLTQRLAMHRDNPSCRDCHAGFDAFGIALEDYDAAGLRRRTAKGRPVDARAELPDGTVVDGAAELRRYIVEQVPESFVHSLLEHLFAYALGRDVQFADEAELAELRDTVREHGDTLRAMLHAIVSSKSFSRP